MSQIKIKLHSDICLGDGQSRGTRIDTDVCADGYGIPYIPARRLKGCLREAAVELQELGFQGVTDEAINELFGGIYGEAGLIQINDAVIPGIDNIHSWIEHVRHSSSDFEKKAVHPNSISKMYTYRRGQTRLNNGVKVDGTLRFINVLKHYDPLEEKNNKELVFVANVSTMGDSNYDELISVCCKTVRHMGMNRNRGLGNISMEYIPDSTDSTKQYDCDELEPEKLYTLEYRIANDAPITLPDCDGIRTSIPAKSIIGILSGKYLKGHDKNSEFDELFLDGTVVWSDLTPVIAGKKSYSVPMLIARLKNDNGKMINRFADNGSLNWKALKPKTIETGYMSQSDNKYFVADLPIRTIYHNSIRNRKLTGEGLYMQDSVESGYVFAGTVTAPGRLIGIIVSVLTQGPLGLGRSKSAQYATCRVTDILSPVPVCDATTDMEIGSPVYVVLDSDYLPKAAGGAPTVDADMIRSAVAEELDLENELPDRAMDMIKYRTVGGYQGMWHLQKPHMQVVSAGSVFCFKAGKTSYPETIQIGKCRQEGFGQCRILSAADVNNIKDLQVGHVERITDKGDFSSDYQKMFREAVVANECKELISDNAEKIAKTFEGLRGERVEGNKKRNGIPSGRLRLLAFEASDYADLRMKIDQMKESDVDSASIGRRWECHELLDEIYGKDRKVMSWQSIIGFNENSTDIIGSIDPGVQKYIEADWKRPLDIILHSLHYSKGGKR